MRLINFLVSPEIFVFDYSIFNFYVWSLCVVTLIAPFFVFFLLIFSVFSFFLEIGIYGFFHLLGVRPVGDLQFFFPVIYRVQDYSNVSHSYFGDLYGSKTEDFFPPFMFSYRNLFFAHLTGWKGIWSYYCKFTRRRVSASVFEWGYTNKIPTFYYRVLRGGFRLQLVTPNIFRRVTGTSQNSPIWFYKFKSKIQKYGHVGDDWDEYNFDWYAAEADDELAVMLSFYKRIRLHFMYLSSWIEKWAPTLSPKSVHPNYFLSSSPASPYSYVNTQFRFFKGAYIDVFESGSQFGFKQKLIDPQLAARDHIGRRVRRYMDYIQFRKKGPQFPKIDRTLPELGDQILIEKEVVFKKIIKVALGVFQNVPYNRPGHLSSGKREYDYFQYFHFKTYNSMIEFYTFILESLYIYPFQLRWAKFDIPVSALKDSAFLDFDFFEIFNDFAVGEANVFFVSFIIIYFLIFVFSFKFGLFFINFFPKKIIKELIDVSYILYI